MKFCFLMFYFFLMSKQLELDIDLLPGGVIKDFSLVSSALINEIPLKMLVDPMSTITLIFENKLNPNLINKITKTGLHTSINNTYGNYYGEFGVELFSFAGVLFRMRTVFVKNLTTSYLPDDVDGILGIGFNRITDYSIFKNTNQLKPYLRYNRRENKLYIGYKPRFFRNGTDSLTGKEPDFEVLKLKMNNGIKTKEHSLNFKVEGIVINETERIKEINSFPITLDFLNRDLILAPKSYEEKLIKDYFPKTEIGRINDPVLVDQINGNSKDNYKNYFYCTECKPNDNVETYFNFGGDNNLIKYNFWQLNNGIPYSTIKLLKSDSIYWSIGTDILGFDNIEFDYDMKDVWMYNDNRMGTVLYALVCIVSVIGVGVVFFMFCLEKKERKRYRKEN